MRESRTTFELRDTKGDSYSSEFNIPCQIVADMRKDENFRDSVGKEAISTSPPVSTLLLSRSLTFLSPSLPDTDDPKSAVDECFFLEFVQPMS